MKIDVWTDGSGTPEPKEPACIGVLVQVDGADAIECSEHVGDGTHNMAELRAIRRGLFLANLVKSQRRMELIDDWDSDDGERTVIQVWTDSMYAIESITVWERPRSYVEWIQAIRGQVSELKDSSTIVVFSHVPGHKGHRGNEIADYLAHIARCRVLKQDPKKLHPDHPKRRDKIGWG